MDPLYSYSMGIARQFPQSFLLYTITTYLVAIQKRLTLRSCDIHKKLLNAPTKAILFGVKEDLIKAFRMKDLGEINTLASKS